jgi:hypothetical protein
MSRIPPDHRLDAAPPGAVAPLAFLAAGARGQTDGTLALCAGVGLVVAAVAIAFIPTWGPLALSALAVAAFGGWGITDRVAAERGARGAAPDRVDAALRVARVALAAAGMLAFLGFALTLLGVLLGSFIS